jgi:hypothetical protein
MAEVPGSLTVYTVPSFWLVGRDRPYDRVVGVLDDHHEHLWTPRVGVYNFDEEIDPNGKYNQKDATERIIEGNDEFSRRLIGFFATFLANEDHSLKSFNCHRFARWMIGGGHSEQDTESPTDIVEYGTLTQPNLLLGQRGVVGQMRYGKPRADHSVVGLGENVPESIQIIDMGGYLAISTYEDMLARYRRALPQHDGDPRVPIYT